MKGKTMSTELTEVTTQNSNTLSVFSGENNFTQAMMMAETLSKSDIIPINYKGKPENCLIAIELSNRLRVSPFLVMQNVHIIQGRPSWSSTFIISCINTCGKFEGGLKYEIDEKETKCRAYAIEKATGKKCVSPTVTLDMARDEGWLTKNGSKWRTMPALMLRYRAASFFGRLFCPELLNGMLSEEEAIEIPPIDVPEEDIIDVLADVTLAVKSLEEVEDGIEQPQLL
jgi:hypothetical protein